MISGINDLVREALPKVPPACSSPSIPRCAVLFTALLLSTNTFSIPAASAFGPHDYRDPEHRVQYLEKVEDIQFTQDVIDFERGSTGSVSHDLNYTLRAYPNQHRALAFMDQLFFKREKGEIQSDSGFYHFFAGMDHSRSSSQYYFQKPVEFAPDDPTLRIIHGIHYHKRKKFDEAIVQYQKAGQLLPTNPEV